LLLDWPEKYLEVLDINREITIVMGSSNNSIVDNTLKDMRRRVESHLFLIK
jgi:hypothetical protein